MEQANAAAFLQVEQQRRQLLEQALERLIGDRLLELEAQARETTVDELIAQEVEAKATAPSDEEVDAFYEAQKSRIGAPKEQVAEQIRAFLLQQRKQGLMEDLLAALRPKFEAKTLLEPYRIAVDDRGFPSRGPEDAPVTIVEFSDFECPFCSRVVPTLDKIRENYGEKVRLVFRNFPLTAIHPHAQKAAEAALCAHEQENFWEMHDTLFREQKALATEQLKEKAARLGLDGEAFNACLDSGKYAETVASDLQAGQAAGVTGTPAIFINGRFLSGAQPYEEIAAVVDDELSRAAE